LLITSGLGTGSTCKVRLALSAKDIGKHGSLNLLHRIQFILELLVFLDLVLKEHNSLLVLMIVSIE